jgi:predicted dehydrogenase
MFIGFNFLIYGSGPITETHINALKKQPNVFIKSIYSNNTLRRNYIAKKFKIKICKELTKKEIQKYNAALITSSSENHLEFIKKTCAAIKYFIVEKPIVCSLKDFKQLINLKKKFNFKFKEVSQNIYFKKIKFIKKIKKILIIVDKKREDSDFKNFKNQYSHDKSLIFRQLPHWIDVVQKITGKKIYLKKINYNKSSKILKNISIDFNCKNTDITIKIDLTKDKNYKTKIFCDKMKIIYDNNFFFNFINFFLKKISKNFALNDFNTQCFELMYKDYLKYFLNNG